MQRQLAILFISLVMLTGASTFATTLSGKIAVSKQFMDQLDELRRESETSNLRGYWSEPNGIKPVAPVRFDLSTDVGVVLFREGAPEPKADPVLSLNVLTGSLEKNVVVIRPKSRIKFIMKSPFDHELYAPGKHDFKPQQQGSNSFRPIDFYSAGVFEVKCKLFPLFQGWIVATPATHVLDVSQSGTFTMEDLEEGNYTLKIFFRGKWIVEKKFEVSGKKQDIAVELRDISGEADTDSKQSLPVRPSDEIKKQADNGDVEPQENN